MEQHIKRIIETALPDATVYVEDPNNDGQHFQAVVISPSFTGVPLVKQHRMVMAPLKDAFAESVHAMALRTFTPEKWAERHS